MMLLLAKKDEGLITLKQLYIDGTKIEANARMFVTEGMDKVRKVIEENRKRKLIKRSRIIPSLKLTTVLPLKLSRQVRSILTEGHFGNIKENYCNNRTNVLKLKAINIIGRV